MWTVAVREDMKSTNHRNVYRYAVKMCATVTHKFDVKGLLFLHVDTSNALKRIKAKWRTKFEHHIQYVIRFGLLSSM